MGRVRAALVGVVLLPLAGCTSTEWVKPSADPARAAADREECGEVARIEARQRGLFESRSRRPALPADMIGYPQAGGSFPEKNAEWYWTRRFLDRCMEARGYRRTPAE